MQKRRSALVFIIAAIAFFAVAGFAIASTISKASEPGKGVLIVGTNTPFPPFEIRRGEKVVGFDIDLVERVASALGRRLVIKDFNEFDALIPALGIKTVDLIASAMTIREDRDEVVDFSTPYFKASQAILALKGNAFVYSGKLSDLGGVRLGYQEGTTSQFWVEANLMDKVAVGSLTPFGDLSFGLRFLQVGSFDLIIVDEPAAKEFVKTDSRLEIKGTIETGEQYGFAVAQGDPKNLLPGINKAIQEMKETGEYDKLIAKWFGGGES